MKRLFAILLVFLMGCAMLPNSVRFDNQYDYGTSMVVHHDLASLKSSIATFETVTHFVNEEDPKIKSEHKMIGMGTVVNGKYILTVEHVVGVDGYYLRGPFGRMKMPGWTVEKRVTTLLAHGERVPLKVLYRNKKLDLALMELPEGITATSFPGKLGDSDDLYVGNFIYLVGNPALGGLNVRQGIVSALQAPAGVSEVNSVAEHTFMISNGLVSGDSGTPVVAIRDGKYEIVGLAQGVFYSSNKLGWAIRINLAKEEMKEWLKN